MANDEHAMRIEQYTTMVAHALKYFRAGEMDKALYWHSGATLVIEAASADYGSVAEKECRQNGC